MKELELIRHIDAMAGPGRDRELLCGIGDDCAVVRKTEELVLLYTMDTLIESVHFDLRWHPPELLGQKAVSVNVSDIAAMGGQPRYVLFSLGLPPDFDDEWALKLSTGVARACEKYGCLLIGGDTVSSPAGITLTLTVIGEVRAEQVLYRHGAQVGDSIYVSGFLGLAAAGLALCKGEIGREEEFKQLYAAHLNPHARVELGSLLGRSGLVNAMMDLSDGLATDLAHICDRSGLGAQIYQKKLPQNAALEKAAALLGQDRLDWIIGGGEDYELLFTVSKGATERLQEVVANFNHVLYPVGTIVRGKGIQLVADVDGERTETPIAYLGFDHFA